MSSVYFFIVFCALVAFVSGQDLNAMQNMPKYDSRYDYLDVEGILDSKRLVRNYVDCLINVKPCTPEGKALKRLLPEALRTKCIRCTDKQKRTAVKVIRKLKYDYPDEWAKLSSRWDPTGDFTRYFEDRLAKETFNTIPGSGNDIIEPLSSPGPFSPSPYLPPAPSTAAPAPADRITSPKPAILNRFKDDGDLMVGSPSMTSTTQTTTTTTTASPSYRPPQNRPTQTSLWGSAGAASEPMATRFPLRPLIDMQPPYTTAITLIDHIGYKIIRTTELVTDILKNTVRAVVGR